MPANVFKKAIKTWNNPKASDLDRALARHQICLGVACGEPHCLKVARELEIDPSRPLDTVFLPDGQDNRLARLLQRGNSKVK